MTLYAAALIDNLYSDRFGVVLFTRQKYLMSNADGSNAEVTHVSHTRTHRYTAPTRLRSRPQMERMNAFLVNFFGQIDSFTIEVFIG